MQAGARASCAAPPLFSSLSILFSFRRALMFLFEKRAFLPGLPGHSLQSTAFPLPNPTEREGRKACRSRGLLGGTVAESMKARPAGEGV
jgi:hypothetical protein